MTNNTLLTTAISVFGPKLFSRLSQSEMCKALGLLDQKQMAQRLGMTYEAFRWQVAQAAIPKPEVKLAKRAYYSRQQAEDIVREALEIREARLNNWREPTQGGPQ